MITNVGKPEIVRFMAGWSGSIARSIAVGTSSVAASATDESLGFEFARADVALVSADLVGQAIIFKATLSEDVAGQITEVGLWSQPAPTVASGSRMLFSFDSNTELWSGTFSTNPVRIGGDSLTLAPAASGSLTRELTGFILDLSGYTTKATITTAFNASSNVSSVKLRLGTDSSNYYETTISTPAAGYVVFSTAREAFSVTGTPSWDNIIYAAVVVSATAGGAATVDMDGIRIDDALADFDNVLIARQVLGAPITKVAGIPMEIEYTLDITL